MSILKTVQALPQVKQHTGRFTEIVAVLTKYGLASWLGAGIPELLARRFKTVSGESIGHLSPNERIREALTELGPTFIKLGQMLSTRSDLIGADLAEELAELQSDTPADPPLSVLTTIESELGRKVDECFGAFDMQPLGSASIGQVHRAELRDGTPVVVKIQHAGIEETIESDLAIMGVLAEVGAAHDDEIARFQPVEVVREFKRSLLGELDYARERLNLDTFRHNFEDDDTVRFPRTHENFCARRVLTMEIIEGTPLADGEALDERGVNRDELARHGADVWIQMILRDGFYHADPHPGNILVCQDGRVGVLDCGMVGHIDGRTLEQFEDIVLALLTKDGEELSRQLLRICKSPADLDARAFQADVGAFCAEHLTRPVADIDFGRAVGEAMAIMREHRLILPGSISQLIKTLAILEGTSRQVSRDFNVVELLEPYKKQIVQKRFAPKYVLQRALQTARGYERLVRALPDDLLDILHRLRSGSFDVQLRHRDLDSIVNRLVYGIVVAALFLGSTLVLSLKVPPLIGEISFFGALGSGVALVLGLRLLWAIGRRGGLGR